MKRHNTARLCAIRISFAPMSFILFTLGLCAPAFAKSSPVIIEKLQMLPIPAGAQQQYACTADRAWCAVRAPADSAAPGALSILRLDQGAMRKIGDIPLLSQEIGDEAPGHAIEAAPWLTIIRFTLQGEGETVLMGAARTNSAGYSGGGGAVTHIHVYEARAGQLGLRYAFEAPWSANVEIRACFSADDVKKRLGACADQYAFRAKLIPAASPATGALSLIYKTRATTYPGKRRRSADSTQAGQLTPKDLRTALYKSCSFTRSLTRDPATGAFAWDDSSLPACADYLEP